MGDLFALEGTPHPASTDRTVDSCTPLLSQGNRCKEATAKADLSMKTKTCGKAGMAPMIPTDG